jgi:hypothetical protein
VQKLVLMSMLIATLWIPIVLARRADARRGVKLMQKRFFAFIAVWVLAVLYVLPRL